MQEQEKFNDMAPEEVLPGAAGQNAAESAESDEADTLREERDKYYDRLLRLQAEFDNYKKRVERERAEYVQFASGELMRELLNVLDSFELAVRNASSDGDSASMLRGMDLIYKQFQDTLARFGLQAVEARNREFDPNIHQAVSTTPTDEVEENTIIDEFRKGYTLHGRLLRPAMVSVSVKGGPGADH